MPARAIAALLLFVAAAGCSGSSQVQQTAPAEPEIKQPTGEIISETPAAAETPVVPVFSISSIDGETIKLENLLGSFPVYLVFIPTTTDSADRDQLQEIETKIEVFEKLGAEVVVVISDWPPPVADLRDELELSYPLIADPLQVIATEWGVFDATGEGRTSPASFVFDSFGTLIARLVSTETENRPSIEEVLNAMEESLRSGTA